MAPSGHRRNLHPKSQASNYLFMKLTSFRFYRIIIKSKSNYRNLHHPRHDTGDSLYKIGRTNTAVFGIIL